MTRGKRAVDVAGALAGLVLCAPVLAAAAVLIRLEDGGPVFFRQERVGRGGRIFLLWKLRSMHAGPAGDAPQLTVRGDARITRVGRWLRRLKLDELPQLVNVLRGEMSLVGPRPEVPRYVALYDAEQRRVLELVPGMIDPASLRFADEAEILAGAQDAESEYVRNILPEKIRASLEYAARASRWSDLALIVSTPAVLLRRKNFASHGVNGVNGVNGGPTSFLL